MEVFSGKPRHSKDFLEEGFGVSLEHSDVLFCTD